MQACQNPCSADNQSKRKADALNPLYCSICRSAEHQGRRGSGAPLAGEDAHKLVADALVLPKHEADLAAAHADVTGRHISVSACQNRQLKDLPPVRIRHTHLKSHAQLSPESSVNPGNTDYTECR